MLKEIFKTSWDRYLQHIGGLIVTTILMFILYLILLKFTILGGEFIKPFFLYGMFHVILNFSESKFPEIIVNPTNDETENFVRNLRHKPGRIDYSHFLHGFSNKEIAFKLLCYGFLKTLFLAIGLILLVIPGIYFEIATIFALPIIVRKNIGVIDSFKQSIALFNENFLEIILIIIILLILHALTAFPYGLFSIIVFPFSMCVIATAYEIYENRSRFNVK
jgi:hypothetical protein